MSEQGLRAAREKMADADVDAAAIESFTRFYRQLEDNESGLIAESDIDPLGDLDQLADVVASPQALADATAGSVIIKLNGGLGTSMGIEQAKSLLPVKDGLTFFDIMVRQVLHRRRHDDARLPMIFMNSFRTHDDFVTAVAAYPDLAVGDLPLDFLQNRVPKLIEESLEPAQWPADPELEWCPPGHGDLYAALSGGGLLERLLAGGYRFAFCSNSDNLGAKFDPRIPAWMAAGDVPFVIESCRRTASDRKGGHLARRKSDGRLILRETAQTAPADLDALGDLDRYRYMNTNNIWIDLNRLREQLDASGGVLDLPMIKNRKTLDPRDSSSPAVIQVESAMGAAIQCFDGARSIVVDRSRFVPVKTTNDLLVIRSDAYRLADDFTVGVAPGREVGQDPIVDLDPRFYRLIDDFDARFPNGPVSLVDCHRLTVEGDVTFAGAVAMSGDVVIRAS
jgi:UTP--glucose-1-phosphate uridylyltransferase